MARGRARFFWATGVVTPWFLGASLLVSFTADAGTEVPSGASPAPLSSTAAVMPKTLVPAPRAMSSAFGDRFGRGMLREARLALGAPEQFDGPPDEVEPRGDLKKDSRIFPRIDRSHKGDPLVGLRPTIDGGSRGKGGVARLRAGTLTFGQDESGLASAFSPDEGETPGPDSVANFEAWPEGQRPTAAPGVVTLRPIALIERAANEGATPAVPRAVALGSSTPYAADSTPVEANVAALPRRGVTQVRRAADKRDWLALIPREKLDDERHCLAQAVYFEARGEPEAGQAAVAQVVLNRMTSGVYPATVCGVVFQNRSHYRACQFSFACEGRSLDIRESEAWTQAQKVADDMLGGRTWLNDVADSTHYHANYVRPRWARSLRKMDVIGKHIFYRLKSG